MGLRIGTAFLAVVALAACAGPTAVASHTPTPAQPTPTLIASPISTLASPTPSPSPRPPLSETLKCRLPISAGSPGSGGFIVFPGGKFVSDPKSNVVVPGIAAASPDPNGNQPKFFGLTYDRAYSKWLPVPLQMVSPDGSLYVYPLSDSVFVVKVVGGAKTELGKGTGHTWNVLNVEKEGVYAIPQQTSGLPPAGLWLLPFSGAPRQITATGYWQGVGGGAAFGFAAPAIPQGAVQSLLRLDLRTGKTSRWLDNLPPGTSVAGFEPPGLPILLVQSTPVQVAVATGLNRSVTLFDGTSLPNVYLTYGVLVDRNGTWLASGSGLYLWTGVVGQIEEVSPVTGPLAGPCA